MQLLKHMVFRAKAYLKFMRFATNQHDVHSPFVYNFVVKSLYTKPKWSQDKRLDIALKSIAYFNPVKIDTGNDSNLENALFNNHGTPRRTDSNFDFCYMPYPDTKKLDQYLSIESTHRNVQFLVASPYLDADRHQQWEQMKAHPEITVTMDLWHCGILFNRKEQAKEHFTVRI